MDYRKKNMPQTLPSKEYTLFVQWCVNQNLRVPLPRHSAIDINNISWMNPGYTISDAMFGRAGRNNEYAGFYNIEDDY